MHYPCIRVDSLLSAREYTAPIHSTGSHPNTSLLRARWTPACTLRRSHIGRYIPGAQLLPQAVRGATSTRSACTLRVERLRRTAVHFFPHTRPPDNHSHLSQPHTTPPLDSGAAVEYQGHSGERLLFACSDQGMPKSKRSPGIPDTLQQLRSLKGVWCAAVKDVNECPGAVYGERSVLQFF